jgi:hypothetical protein
VYPRIISARYTQRLEQCDTRRTLLYTNSTQPSNGCKTRLRVLDPTCERNPYRLCAHFDPVIHLTVGPVAVAISLVRMCARLVLTRTYSKVCCSLHTLPLAQQCSDVWHAATIHGSRQSERSPSPQTAHTHDAFAVTSRIEPTTGHRCHSNCARANVHAHRESSVTQ